VSVAAVDPPDAGQAPTETAGGRDVLLLVPGLLVLVTGLLLSVLDSGFDPTVWYPAALFLLVLLALTVFVAPPRRVERGRLVTVSVVLYGLFCVWSYLGIAWADAPGSAWEGANRALLYGLAIAIVVLRPWSRRAATIAFALAGGVLTAIATVVLIAGMGDPDPSNLLQEGRLAEPAGYVNATAGLWLIGVWPLLALAIDRALPLAARALSIGAATLLMQAAFLSQSRGAAIALVAAAAVYVALNTRRWPALLTLAVPLAATYLTFDTIAKVREAPTVAALTPAFDSAVEAILIAAVVATAVAAVGLLVGRRGEPLAASRPTLRRNGDLALLALAVLAAVGVLAAMGNPADWADERWQDFKTTGYSEVNSSENRFTGSLGSGRYDFYRVAWSQFEDSPLVGVGQDNFANPYLERREGNEAPRHPHSLVLRMLSQAGLIGSALFFAALALLLAAAWNGRRRLRGVGDQAVLAVGGIATFVAWFVQAAGDWLWVFPALGIVALTLLGVAARLGEEEAPPEPDIAVDGGPGARARLIANRSALAAGVLLAGLSLVCAGIAARYTSAAYDSSASDIETAVERLDRAAELNPLSAEPLLAKGVLAQRIGRYDEAKEALDEATEREPDNWFIHFERALAESAQGDNRAALADAREAKRLNPRQPLVDEVLAELRAGRRVDAAVVEGKLTRALENRLSPVDPNAARER
jgi:tetratricopeptide (TPR) repeat protein